MKRVFLGWKTGALRAAAIYLCEQLAAQGMIDLTRHTIVLPSRRAGRRLREILIDVAAERKLALFPPQIATVGSLPELLYERKQPFASALVQQLAWADALKKTDRRTLKKVVVQYPATLDDPRWMELGALLQRQHLELTEHQLDFAAVAEQGTQLDGFTDSARWKALAKIQRDYLDSLHKLELWDRQTARNFAIEHNECRFDGYLVLLGTVDLSRTTRAMLGQVQCDVTSLVASDSNMSTYFDEYGCVDPDAWQSHNLNVEDHQILLADGPANQADALVLAMDQFDGQYAPEDITVGIPDAELVPYIESKLKQFRVNVRWGAGKSLAASPPFQWLRLAAEYLNSYRYDSLAELMRHSDTQRYLTSHKYPADAVKELDRYFERHLPDVLHASQPHAGDLPKSVELVCELLLPLTDLRTKQKKKQQRKLKKPANWGQSIHDVLMQLYERRQLNVHDDHDRTTLQACEQIVLSMERFAALPDDLAPEISASTAILMLLSQIDEDEFAPAAGDHAIEMVGWLDLPLDDAKVAIVTSMNDGVVPKSVSSDVFLPNAFRQALGLDDNVRRYARDAYAVHVLLNSKMVVRFIVGRRAASNDPLRPSRLLMSCSREILAKRCLRLFNGTADCQPIVMPVQRDTMAFTVPRPIPMSTPVESLSVSDFARYLNCPYRFYLTKIQRLRTVEDRTSEISATTFGDLAHEVLERFGECELKDSSDESEIRLYLHEQASRLAKQRFGLHPKPTVQVQIAQLKSRLAAFATQQAKWRQAGWTIMKTELTEDHGELIVDGEPMRLRGRIDRIDRRTVDGIVEYALLDYKTSDKAASPDDKHLKKRDGKVREHWVDLQLPLYLHLLQSIPETQNQPTRLGYILLPSDSKQTQFSIASWSVDELRTADEAAHQIVRQIREQRFWPPTDPYPFKNNDDFAAIVQNGVFGREPFELEVMGA